MSEKEKEIERLLNQERELRRELRNWQQRVFQLEAEVSFCHIMSFSSHKFQMYQRLIEMICKH